MRRYWGILLLVVGVLLGVSPVLAKGPPDKAVISGPGITGEVAITDAATLADMGLGSLEDFQSPLNAPSQTAAGYQIDRFFRNGGTFQPFDRLVYYPPASGERGRIFYAGMAVVGYGSSDYDGKWFRATAAGDAAMQRLLGHLAPQLGLPATGTISSRAGLVTLLVGLLLIVGAGYLIFGAPARSDQWAQQPEAPRPTEAAQAARRADKASAAIPAQRQDPRTATAPPARGSVSAVQTESGGARQKEAQAMSLEEIQAMMQRLRAVGAAQEPVEEKEKERAWGEDRPS
jgi:hypothetical protein